MMGSSIVTGLTLLAVVIGLADADVEFKHHNNTDMAEILQQVHNRYEYFDLFLRRTFLKRN